MAIYVLKGIRYMKLYTCFENGHPLTTQINISRRYRPSTHSNSLVNFYQTYLYKHVYQKLVKQYISILLALLGRCKLLSMNDSSFGSLNIFHSPNFLRPNNSFATVVIAHCICQCDMINGCRLPICCVYFRLITLNTTSSMSRNRDILTLGVLTPGRMTEL